MGRCLADAIVAEIGRTEMRLQIDRYTTGDMDGVQVGYNRVWM